METVLYRQIADDIRRTIEEGELEPGERLPTETELQQQHSASRNTIRLALKLLIDEGLIYTLPRRGTFVRDRRPLRFVLHDELLTAPPGPEHEAFKAEVLQDGLELRQSIEIVIVDPSAEISSRLRLPEGVSAVVRRRVRYVNGDPCMINDTYFPASIVEGTDIARPRVIPKGANRVLDDLGYTQVRVEDQIFSRLPTADESARLQLRPVTPVTAHIRTGFDRQDRPVRVAVTIMPGDKGYLIYNLSLT